MGKSKYFNGERVEIMSRDGTFLFGLNLPNGSSTTRIVAQDFYEDYSIQWFDPEADNYLPLVDTAQNIQNLPQFKHFSWQDVANFAMVDRFMIAYRTKGAGDWKTVANGADGYLLVTVDNFPYWADGVGQIPFAVDSFKHYLADGYSEEDSIKGTLLDAQKHSTGNIIPTAPVIVNEYDDYFVIRGAIWASRMYDAKVETHESIKDGVQTKVYKVVKANAPPPASDLGKSLTPDIPRKYGLI